MNFRLEVLPDGTGKLARGEALRWMVGFIEVDAGEIRDIRKSGVKAEAKASK